jgi:hypothetical protein
VAVRRWYDPVGDQYVWASSAAVQGQLGAQAALWDEGVVSWGWGSAQAALAAGGLGLAVVSLADQRAGGVGTFTLGVDASLVGTPGVVGDVAFWL